MPEVPAVSAHSHASASVDVHGGASAQFVERVRAVVEPALRVRLDDAAARASTSARESLPVLEQVRALTLRGGKRLRPALLAAAVECIAPWESLAPAVAAAGCALELLQSYLLIHDDWMDGDSLRRGGPTAHVALAGLGGAGTGPHRGAALAVLAGDLACALAQESLALAPVEPARTAALYLAFAHLQRDVVLGQTLDVLGSDDERAVLDLKTGSYTVRGPLALGHALAGGSESAWRALHAFADPLGLAFQLRDDLLGAFGDARETGKGASGADLRAGKKTAPVREALAALEPGRARELESLLGRDDDAAVARAQELLHAVGAAERVEARIAALRDEGLRALDGPALRAEGRECLAALALALTARRA